MAQYVLTGSQNFQISQNDLLIQGTYPGKYTRDINKTDFYKDYINTYITRDVRTLKNIGDLSNFLRFIQLLAGRVGQLFNANELANSLRVNFKTIQQWFSVLEASYIAYRLEPYYENFGKRLKKSPKVYLYDISILNYLLGINNEGELSRHPLYGNIFENFIISEKLKQIYGTRVNEKLFFCRDSNGVEAEKYNTIGKLVYQGDIEQAINEVNLINWRNF